MCLFFSCCASPADDIDETDCGECSQQCEFIEEIAHFCSSSISSSSSSLRETSYVFFSLNCQLLRGVCRGQGGRPSYLLLRAACLANRLASIEEFVDAIALQECFDEESTSLLIRKLSAYFPHVIRGKAKSGLVILSKLPVRHSVFHEFKTSSGGERLFFNKGVLGVALSDPDEDTTVCMFNAHLQSDFWRESRETREEQAKEMKTFVQKSIHSRVFVGSSSGDVIDAAVVCGDLNCIAGSAEYEKIMEVLGGEKQTFRDTLPIGDDDDESLQTFPECTYSLKKGRYVVVDETTKKKRLDYIFEISEEGEVKMSRRRKTKARVVRALRDDNNVPLSDHRGIIAAIERVYN
jgi:endonuclease/exonuclease/phosphatase family metal-dependent hydrolase